MSVIAAVAVVAAVAAARTDRRARLRLPRHGRPAVPARRARGVRALVPVVVIAAVAAAVAGPQPTAVMTLVVVALLVRRRWRGDDSLAAGAVAIGLDVLAACLASGASMPAALAAAAAAAPPRVADALSTAAAGLSRGEDPVTTWTQVGVDVPELAGAGRLCARAASTGAAVADELHRLAAAERAATDASRRRRLQRASVWLVLPLGLCFLPAFVLVGVVPLVVATLPTLTR